MTNAKFGRLYIDGAGKLLVSGPDARPRNCRNRLSAEGKPHPRSGCDHCGTGGLTGCPYEPKGLDGRPV